MDKIYSHSSSIFTENHKKKENISKEDTRGTTHAEPRRHQKHTTTQRKTKAKNRIVLRIPNLTHAHIVKKKSHLLYLLYHTVI